MLPQACCYEMYAVCVFFSSRRRHTRLSGDWSSDVCSSDLAFNAAIRERKNARGAGRTKEWSHQSEGGMFAEQVELPRVVVITIGRDGLVMTAYLGEVGRLELQGDLHQHVRNVSGGFIGEGVFRVFG